MQIIYFNDTRKKLIYSDGTELINSLDYPKLTYQSLTQLEVNIFDEDSSGILSGKNVSNIVTWKSATDKDYSSSTDPMTRTLDADIDSSNANQGKIIITVDCDTVKFKEAIDGIDNGQKQVYFNLVGYDINDKPKLVIKFSVIAENIIDPNTGDPGTPPDNYYTKSQSLSTFHQLASDKSSTLTNASATDIFLIDKTLFRSVRFDGILDNGTNYNRISGYVTHNGTTANVFYEQDDYPNFIDLDDCITANISGDNVQLNIDNQTGSDIQFNYTLYNYITIWGEEWEGF